MIPSTTKATSQKATDYYPFGLTFYDGENPGATTLTQNRYLYNGKLERSGNPDPLGELQDDFGLFWHDYVARFYNNSSEIQQAYGAPTNLEGSARRLSRRERRQR